MCRRFDTLQKLRSHSKVPEGQNRCFIKKLQDLQKVHTELTTYRTYRRSIQKLQDLQKVHTEVTGPTENSYRVTGLTEGPYRSYRTYRKFLQKYRTYRKFLHKVEDLQEIDTEVIDVTYGS